MHFISNQLRVSVTECHRGLGMKDLQGCSLRVRGGEDRPRSAMSGAIACFSE